MGVGPGSAPGAITLLVSLSAWAGAALLLFVFALIWGIRQRDAQRSALQSAVAVGTATLAAVWTKLVIQDRLLEVLGGTVPAPGLLPYRLATNAIVWLAVLSTVAIGVQIVHEKRRATATLLDVLTAMTGAERRARADAELARSLVGKESAALIRQAAAIRTRNDVRAFTEGPLRNASHRWARMADGRETLSGGSHPPSAPSVPPVAGNSSLRSPLHASLRLPPVWLVTVVYTAMLLPYALRTSPVHWLVLDVLLAVTAGVAADYVPRRLLRGSSSSVRVAMHVALAAFGGAVISLSVGQRATDGSALWLVPLFAFPATAIVLSWCAGLAHRLFTQERRIEGAVRRHRRTLAASVHHRRHLREAAQLLHGEAQSLCVLFLSRPASGDSADLEALRAQLIQMLEELPAHAETQQVTGRIGIDAIRALLDTWGRVLDIQDEIDAAAASAIAADAELASDAYDIVAEALINAVKHSDATAAQVAITQRATGAGSELVIQVRTRGVLVPGAMLRATSRVSMLGARIDQDGVDVRLLAALPITAVVSAVHASVRAESGS